jgi:hypothetical protein
MAQGRSKIIIILLGKGLVGGLLHLGLVLGKENLIDGNLGGSQGRGGNELLERGGQERARLNGCDLEWETYKSGIADELASEPEEWLLEVIVGLGRNVVVLEVLFPVESDGLGLDLALLDIDLVTAENDGDVLANTGEIACGES